MKVGERMRATVEDLSAQAKEIQSRREKIHILKTWPEFFKLVKSGVKRFEIRKDDRDFQLGDKVTLVEYDPREDSYSGESITFEITFKLKGGRFGLEAGFCVLGIK